MKYTHHNNELTLKDVNKTVTLKGWVAKVRNLGGLIFIDLRDRFGLTQLRCKPENPNYQTALKIRNEFVIEAEGIVLERESKNLGMVTGSIEVDITKLTILSAAETPPIIVSDETDALEETRLKYRYLDLRRPRMQNFLIKRHDITQSIRRTLIDLGFYELETPILGKSTPEGARDYLVPSRLYPGTFYALPQSPQIYKQLFMVAGFEKYFQIARCFRDEDLRADRQPEFTQVDVEASFVDEGDVQGVIEAIMVNLFKDVMNRTIQTPFQRMTYFDAMTIYGTDKPDLRYGLLIEDFTEILSHLELPLFLGKKMIRGIKVPKGASLTRKQIDRLTLLVKKNHGEALATLKLLNGELSGSLAKFVPQEDLDRLGLEEEMMIFFVPGGFKDTSSALSALRIELANYFNLIPEDDYKFVWITDWPLLEYDSEIKRFFAMHHPFTAPKDAEVLRNNPNEAMAKAYDIVLNGYEIGGGSIRIHDQNVQRLMFDTLGLTDKDIEERFGFFVDALKYGTPPHGGLALGLDRIVMMLTKTANIKDVIAFPKTQSAKDLMMQAPSEVDNEQLSDLKIKVEKQ